MYLGVGFPGRKATKGMKRVSMVAATPAETMMICWRRVIPFFFLRVRNIRMKTMLGMMKWSALNIVRHSPEIINPEILLVWSFSRSQLSAKIAVNIAVSTKSNPFEVEVEERTDEAAQRSPDNPIGFIEPGNPEQVPSIEGRF